MEQHMFDTQGLIGKEAPSRRTRTIVILFLVALVAVVSIHYVNRTTGTTVEMPRAAGSRQVIGGAALPRAPQTTFSGQQYWDLAAEHARLTAPVGNAPATFSTQQYWDMAAEAEPDAYYTEKYWKMSR